MFSTMNKRINHLGSLFDVLMNVHCQGLSVIARNEAILTICIHAARDVHKHFVIFANRLYLKRFCPPGI